MQGRKNLDKVTAAGLLVAMGIIYGDIGTSPLYVFNAIVNDKVITEALILGSLSCIIWTLTLQTTVKYVILTLRADNNGEGGPFSLYALVRRRRKWLVIPAMIGGAALLSDGIITPPISITSAIEGLKTIPGLEHIQQSTIVYIVLFILTIFFIFQQFGTSSIGKLFGPVMLIWFSMLAVLGVSHISDDFSVLRAFSPHYAISFLSTYPDALWILGAVFLCTTGAEALYSDLGHCGRGNIRVSWGFVKSALLLNYLGQGANLLSHYNGIKITDGVDLNAFFDLMPSWFLLIGIGIATAAAIIASQAMITGSFTLIGEAMRLNLWPRMKVSYPSEEKGQLFIPGINWLMYVGCCAVVLYFKRSAGMEAAYGLAITLTMIATTILFANFLVQKRVHRAWIYLFLVVYATIETTFLMANLLKFSHGGYITMIIAGCIFTIMFVWFRARKIKNRFIEFEKLEDYIPLLQELSNDKSVPKYATHLVYLTSANNAREIESKIMISILYRKPKRADIYWFVHVHTVDDPYTCEYSVDHIIPNDIIRIEFRLGFRVLQRINLMFRKVVEDLVANNEVNITSRYDSLGKNNITGDFQFVVMEKFLSQDNELPLIDNIIMKMHFWVKEVSLSEARGFGLDNSFVVIEKFPLIVAPVHDLGLKRIQSDMEREY